MQIEEYNEFSKIYEKFKQNNEDFNNIMMEILDFEMQKSLNTILSTRNVESKDSSKTIVRKQFTVKRKDDKANKESSGISLGGMNSGLFFNNFQNTSNQSNMFTE